MLIPLKDILPQNENFVKYFLALCSPLNLLKRNIKAVFRLFLCAFLLSCGIARSVIQAETGVSASARVIRSGQ